MNLQISELFNRLKSRNTESFKSQGNVYLRRMEELYLHIVNTVHYVSYLQWEVSEILPERIS